MIKMNLSNNPRHLGYLAAFGAAIAALIWGGAYWWANQAGVAALKTGEAVRDRNVSQSEVLGFTKLLDRTANDRALVNDYFVTSTTVVDFLTMLETLSDTAGVVLEITEVVEGEKLSVALKATGSFAKLNHFLDLLAQAPYFLEFDQIRLSYGLLPTVGKKANAALAWTAEIDLTVISFN